MFFDKIYTSFAESWMLLFLLVFTVAHIVFTQGTHLIQQLIIKKHGFYTSSLGDRQWFSIHDMSFPVMLVDMIALPIIALSSSHYWIYLGLSVVLMVSLFFSSITHNDRVAYGNPGSIAFMIFPLYFVPAVIISIVLHLFGIGGE